jgi:CO/xanthine dehydrogenase Mo-binding subunit
LYLLLAGSGANLDDVAAVGVRGPGLGQKLIPIFERSNSLNANGSRFQVSRREFIKVSSLGGIWLVTRNLTGFASVPSPQGSDVPGWSGPPGKARYRIEGLAKVLGKKIYARDFRARDMEDWPADEVWAMVLRTSVVGRILSGIDLSVLPSDLQPIRTITAADMAKDGLTFPSSDKPAGSAIASLFAAIGTAPQFLGQPVAILLFKNSRTYVCAHRILQFNPSVLKFAGVPPVSEPPVGQAAAPMYLPRLAFKATGEEGDSAEPYHRKAYLVRPEPPGDVPSYAPPTYLTRYADATGEKFSQIMNGPTDPSGTSAADKQAANWRQTIDAEMQSSGWRIFDGEYETQQLDPMFMEPESGLGWLDAQKETLHLVIGTQSCNGCVADSIVMFGAKGCSFKVSTIVLNACYPGGGFGGRDVSTFPTVLAIAAAYADRPVRIAYDRFEQFQSGLKQLGADISQRLAVDAQGRFQAIAAKYNLRAGGRNNYSQWVAELAGYCGSGGYVIPRVSIDAKARTSIGVIAGSMRGFGGPQAAFALESLVDEVAHELNADPIELRQRNALAQGGYTATGYQVTQSLRIAEICKRARAHSLWDQREQVRRKLSADGVMYGVGFALANQAFGTGSDGVMATVEIAPDGTIGVVTNCVDMGNGSATALAISTAALGANATRIQLGEVTSFRALNITTKPSDDWKNPQYTPAASMSSSACITAFHQVHAVQQACNVLLENAIWPAARVLWKLPASQPFDPAKIGWDKGALVMAGQPPLRLKQLSGELRGAGGMVAAMVHASYLGQWIQASFLLNNQTWTGLIDALAVRNGGTDSWAVINRSSVIPPPESAWNNGRSLYAPSGTLAAVAVNPRRGSVKVLAVHSYLEAGSVIQPDLLMGQYYGGVAMGVGYAFHEEFPQTYGGPGEGGWNLNRYHVPMWGDLPVDRITLELLEPQSPGEPGRGIAEAVLCPVPPALSNAVGDATGKRFRSLPITPKKILEAIS